MAAAVTAPPTVAAPVPTAPTAAPMSVAVAAPSEPVEPAHEETPIHKAVAPHAGAEKAPAPASHASAFAGLDAERGNSATPVAPKSDGKAADLPGGLDQAEITGVIKRNLKAVQGCYQRQLKKDDSMTGGRATIRFRILADGRAQNVEMERKFDGTVLKECIITVVERWVFPPFSGDPIPVEFPVIFTATL